MCCAVNGGDEMSIGRTNFDEITEGDIFALINAAVPEGLNIEYKRDQYGRSDSDVKEFLKDVSSFANSAGGHILIGVEATNGCAGSTAPLTLADVDGEVLRLDNLIRDGIEPRISGVRIKPVPASAGGVVLVIRVPKSWNPPHRVSARNTNRIYVRNSAGVHEASIEELRALFNLSATGMERARSFRSERLLKVEADEGPLVLARDLGLLFLHVIPLNAFASSIQVDLEKAYQLHASLRPMASMGYTPRYNFEGFLNHRGGEQCFGYTQLFRNGAIEATKVRIAMKRDGHVIIPSVDFDRHILEVAPGYLSALHELEVPPPLIVTMTLTGTKGAQLGVSTEQFAFDPPPPIQHSVLELPEIVIDDYGTERDYQKALRPAFDALWNTAGFARSQHFDQNDVWVGAAPR